MACRTHIGCQREFRINRQQRDAALERAFRLDRNSPHADVPGRYPYRWEVRKVGLLVLHYSLGIQMWFLLREEENLGVPVPGVGVHIVVFKVVGDTLMFSQDARLHEQGEQIFKMELLGVHGSYTVPLDDLAQDRELLRQAMDELELPESWQPPPPPESAPPPPP